MDFPIEGPNHCTTLMVVKFYLNDEHLYCCAADSQSTLIRPDSSPVISGYCEKVFRLNRRLLALIGGNAVCADILFSALYNSCAIQCRPQHFLSIALEGIDSKFQAVADSDSDLMRTHDRSKDFKMVTALIVDRMLDNLGVMRICVWLKSKENFCKVHIDCNFEKERFVAVGAVKIHRINFEINDCDEAVERVFDAMDDECQTNQFSGGHCCVYSGGPSRDWFPQSRLIDIGEKKELRNLQLEEPTASEKNLKRAAKKNLKRAAKRKQKRAAKRRKAQTGAENDLKGSLAPSIHCALYTSFGHHLKQASKLMEEAKRSMPVAEEKAVDEEPLVFANKLEAKNAFKSLLESVNVECDWTWEQATRVIINDKRYGALKTLGERMQAFNEYLGQRKKQEAEERRIRQKKAREEFTKMLELVPPRGHSLVVPMQWKQVDGIDHH